ncbi:MAG: hypothetical protein D6713_10930 [Deltaproteobacteria bacterium]|nr:MAG: hypothetical protein D6713_10930 [Deltaproteobacteria bacterium]
MPVNVAFLWHMHQPLYRDPDEGIFILPWVRLHAVKDYLFVARMMERYPRVRHTVNFVPSLLLQIESYRKGGKDIYLVLSEKDTGQLSPDERTFVVDRFFSVSPKIRKRYPRYDELHSLAQRARREGRSPAEMFGTQELRDLIVLFNLAWVNPIHDGEFPILRELREKGRLYTEEEKQFLLDVHAEILSLVIPAWKNLASRKVVDLSTSPLHHPILPILVDSSDCVPPGVKLPPGLKVSFPEDARRQVREGIRVFREFFGEKTSILWPPEGSVSEKALHILKEEGVEIAFSDETVLFSSLGIEGKRDERGIPSSWRDLYVPWLAPGGGPILFFRDHALSDYIGFSYQSMPPDEGASHLVSSLEKIHDFIEIQREDPDNFIVSLIFDGENPWENYDNYGIDFLECLFRCLEDSGKVTVTTFKDFLRSTEGKTVKALPRVSPGSWIDGTFRIWFGHEEDFRAWQEVVRAREKLEKGKDSVSCERALESILVAEGSDWYWWYGDDHHTENLDEFDSLFRKYLIKAYLELNVNVPNSLNQKIYSPRRISRVVPGEYILKPRGFVTPVVDGRVTDFYEWVDAASFRMERVFGAMHPGGVGIVDRIFAGFDRERLSLRVDLCDEIKKTDLTVTVSLVFGERAFTFCLSPGEKKIVEKREVPEFVDAEFESILEVSIPISRLPHVKKGKTREIRFSLRAGPGEVITEFSPPEGNFVVVITPQDPSLTEWLI